MRGQELDFYGKVEGLVQGGTGEELPFWMYSNSRGRLSKGTNALVAATLSSVYDFRNGGRLEAGIGFFTGDQQDNPVAIDEAYLRYSKDWFQITAGAKQQEELYAGLSGTNRSILHSLNARPLPGLEIGTVRPVFLAPWLGFEAKWGEYILEEDRYIPWTRVHHKSFQMVIRPADDWMIKAGLLHFAQWGGNSPDFGPQPSGLQDYLKIITGRHGGEAAIATEQQNTLGNHLGSWELNVQRKYRDFSLELLYNSIFEDGSGSRLANFPDGRYGLFLQKLDSEVLFSAFIYEFYYTRDQSRTGPHLYDQYFNSYLYQSGWTFHEKVIGAPFFLYDKVKDQIISNKFLVHHFGVSGNLPSSYDIYPYRFLLSFAQNEGTFGTSLFPGDVIEHKLSILFDIRIFNSIYDNFHINFLFATDYSNMANPNYAAGVSLKYVVE
ncbi:capsule assembly Wzi family protein [Salinimicrobium sediminilitoris]|uniref:capsule assembly Wzi family protein n=1 Tax=Salinimicrobium sediminilitoris TaxID=2876715 RepID=UPI001E44B086|nr:capsule assembly Wzi family protein [Salinimicrobium sediminilitoris]MCC8358439.1 capsule assembly Wzi family protein [Salinimicrobium sediminilitoris]